MKEAEFAYRVRQALNEGADRLPYRAPCAPGTGPPRPRWRAIRWAWKGPFGCRALRFVPQGGGLAGLVSDRAGLALDSSLKFGGSDRRPGARFRRHLPLA